MQRTVEDDLYLQPYVEAKCLLDELIEKIKNKLAKNTGTAGDLTRLINTRIDVQHHLDAGNIKEIECTWVDPEFVNEQ